MKSYFYCIYACVLILLSSCHNESQLFSTFEENDAYREFEQDFVLNTRSIDTNTLGKIRLIGYTSVSYSQDQQPIVRDIWENNMDEIRSFKNFYTAPDGSYALVYCPLRDAIIKYKNQIIIADNEGYVNIDKTNFDPKLLKVIGANASEKRIKTSFKYPYAVATSYSDNNTLVFYLGERYPSCNKSILKRIVSRSESTNSQRVSCTQNHRPYRNCTEAYPDLATGRCETKYDRCMDYNGVGNSNCVESHLYFVGSDCSKALANGHCWNEIGMRNE